jgi:hypothetical protein
MFFEGVATSNDGPLSITLELQFCGLKARDG